MEHFPLEVIGNILSHLGAARDVVVASSTCKKWREAFKKHVHMLFLRSDDWPNDIATWQLEVIMTRIIFQMVGLQCLVIHVDSAHEFSTAIVIAWLMYTRKTLRSLSYNVRTTLEVNVLEECGRQNLETLDLNHNSIIRFAPKYQRFPCLKSLSLSHVSISALDLCLFVAVCPRLESLTLDAIEILTSDSQPSIELSSHTLKCIFARSLVVDKIILVADNLKSLHLSALNFNFFELIGKNTLEHLKIKDVKVTHLDIGENMSHLRDVDVNNFVIALPEFYQTISKASKLRKLRLWGAVFDHEYKFIDPECIACSFPELKHLALSYKIRDGLHRNGMQDLSTLENVEILELGWTVIGENFEHWVFGMIERCPNLKKLVIHSALSEKKMCEEPQMSVIISSFLAALMGKYIHLDVQFVDE